MPSEFRIKRLSDRAVVENILKLSKSVQLPIETISLRYGGDQSHQLPPETLQAELESSEGILQDCAIFDTFSVHFRRQASVTVQRERSHPFDKVTLNLGPQIQADVIAGTKILRQAHEHLEAIAPDLEIRGFLDEASERYIVAQYKALGELKEIAGGLVTQLSEHAEKYENRFVERADGLEKDFGERKAQLAAEYEQQNQTLKEKEQQLAEHEEQLDDRANTHVRRELREKLTNSGDEAKLSSSTMTVSPSTSNRTPRF